jgi:hypothetical protein
LARQLKVVASLSPIHQRLFIATLSTRHSPGSCMPQGIVVQTSSARPRLDEMKLRDHLFLCTPWKMTRLAQPLVVSYSRSTHRALVEVLPESDGDPLNRLVNGRAIAGTAGERSGGRDVAAAVDQLGTPKPARPPGTARVEKGAPMRHDEERFNESGRGYSTRREAG